MDKNTLEKIKKLKNKQGVLKARLQAIENRVKTQERKIETRRKILVGSYFLDKYRDENKFEDLICIMDKYLVRESDRKTFDLTSVKDEDAKEKKNG